MLSILIAFLCLCVTQTVYSLQQGVSIDRSRWTASADSQQAGEEAGRAIDGNDNTLWHTPYDNAPGPHFITIDMKVSYLVTGLNYRPRQDPQYENGMIAEHEIHLSQDGNNWGNPVVVGTWRKDRATKQSTFVPRPARYVRLRALSEVNGGPWASAADIQIFQIPDTRLDRNGWTVSASSTEMTREQDPPANAIDGRLDTFWHTVWSNNVNPPYPHYFEIDVGQIRSISGFSYQPRTGNVQPENGRVGGYRIERSDNRQQWVQVAAGNWADDAFEKVATFGAINTRYIRLVALSEAGGRGPWASAGEINLLSGSALANYRAPDPRLGLWEKTIDLPLVPAAAANIVSTAASTYNGQVLLWSAYSLDQFVPDSQGRTQTSIWNPGNGRVSSFQVQNTNHDMFCPGISTDINGRIIVTGGNNAFTTSIYDPRSSSWSRAADMRLGRGYQATTTLSDGNIFNIGGSWAPGGGTGNKNGELYDVGRNTWTLLPGAPVRPMLTNDAEGAYRSDNHGWLFSWTGGSVLQAGPSRAMNWYGTANGGSQRGAGARANDGDSMNGIAVMFDARAGGILTTGGAPSYQASDAHARSHLIVINGANNNPNVRQLANMAFTRAFHTAVVMPDGNVFIVGGQGRAQPFTDDTAVYIPELWDPRTNGFTRLNAHAVPRTYHSVSILLPDATILTAGGGLCGGCDYNHFDGEVFTPPYLLNADGSRRARPVINSLSATSVRVGGSFTVNANQNIVSVAMIRVSSATHTVNTDQRRVPFDGLNSQNPTLTLPNNSGIMIPGFYMVFALNSAGTPSEARMIQVTL